MGDPGAVVSVLTFRLYSPNPSALGKIPKHGKREDLRLSTDKRVREGPRGVRGFCEAEPLLRVLTVMGQGWVMISAVLTLYRTV